MRRIVNENKEYVDSTSESLQNLIRLSMDLLYDFQRTRIACENRIGDYVRSLKVLDEGTAQGAIIKMAVRAHDTIEEFVNGRRCQWKTIEYNLGSKLKVIKDFTLYQMVKSYVMLKGAEAGQTLALKKLVEQHPMWNLFLKDVRGCGITVAANLLGYLNIHQARHVSPFWSYAGVGTRMGDDGERVAMSKRCTAEVEYVTKDGEVKTKRSIGYNPELHSKLLSVFVDCCLKAGTKDNYYAEIYYDYKNRYANRADLQDASKMRLHRMAARQCVKALLRDLWVTWRSYAGYEVSRPYEVEYLNRAPHKYNEAHNNAATV